MTYGNITNVVATIPVAFTFFVFLVVLGKCTCMAVKNRTIVLAAVVGDIAIVFPECKSKDNDNLVCRIYRLDDTSNHKILSNLSWAAIGMLHVSAIAFLTLILIQGITVMHNLFGW